MKPERATSKLPQPPEGDSDVEEDEILDAGFLGGGNWDSSPKTTYPYRDGFPHGLTASAEYVLGSFEAAIAPVLRILPDATVKIALNLGGITDGLSSRVTWRAQQCVVALKRADIKNLRWILAVNCGNVPRVVRVKAFRTKSNATKLSKMDLDMSCSCPAWQWSGAEHHSQREDYLDGDPRGTASVPVIRDPEGVNRVCKHVAAVLEHVKKWEVGQQKKKKGQ